MCKNSTRMRKRNLSKRVFCAALSAAVLGGMALPVNSEEVFVEEIGEEAYASLPEEEILWEEDNISVDKADQAEVTSETLEDVMIMDENPEEITDDIFDDIVTEEDEEDPDQETLDEILSDIEFAEEADTEAINLAGDEIADTETAEENLTGDDTQTETQTENSVEVLVEELTEGSTEEEPYTETESRSGECGALEGTVFWKLDEEGILHIYGDGDMKDWESNQKVPWYALGEQVKELDIQEGVSSIGSYAFGCCSGLASVHIG